MSEAQAVIVLAAGQGTRMKSQLPKVLHPLAGRSLLMHAVLAAAEVNPKHLCVVVRHQRDRVVEHLRAEYDGDLVIADQDDIMGTGRAVWCGLEGLREAGCPVFGTVLVTSGDVPLLRGDTLNELVDIHEAGGAAVTVVSTIAADPTGYGRIVKDASGQVQAIVEHRDATDTQREIKEINAGIYAFDLEFLAQTLPNLGTDNDQGEVYLTDTVGAAVAAGLKVQSMVLADTWQAEGCNDRAQLASLEAEYRRRRCDELMKAGVSIVDPAATYIDAGAVVEPDVRLEPGVQLRGNTRVETGAVIGGGSILIDAQIGAGALVKMSFIEKVTIGAKEVVGPFAALS